MCSCAAVGPRSKWVWGKGGLLQQNANNTKVPYPVKVLQGPHVGALDVVHAGLQQPHEGGAGPTPVHKRKHAVQLHAQHAGLAQGGNLHIQQPARGNGTGDKLFQPRGEVGWAWVGSAATQLHWVGTILKQRVTVAS
jgi:hypothetical protein